MFLTIDCDGVSVFLKAHMYSERADWAWQFIDTCLPGNVKSEFAGLLGVGAQSDLVYIMSFRPGRALAPKKNEEKE